jgi:LysM repeat protein
MEPVRGGEVVRAGRRLPVGALVAALALAGACTYRSGEVSKPPPTTTTAPPPTTTTAPPEPGQYTVQAGDTPSAIAQRFGITVEALLEANEIRDTGSLQVGQVLEIPVPPA